MTTFRDAIANETKITRTTNGAVCLATTSNGLLDWFGRSGSIRTISDSEKRVLFDAAWREDPLAALKLLFYTRDVRGGYGERDTFRTVFAHLGNIAPDVVKANLWAVLEFGRADDLYALIGTKAEDAMWEFINNQLTIDVKNMNAGKSISLLAKWIKTPDASTESTAALGKLTAKKLGYDFKTMREYKSVLRALRKYLNINESKMAANEWDKIEYAKASSRFIFTHRKAFMNHDKERYTEFLNKADKGEVKMNMSTVTPADIILKVRKGYTPDMETMWKALADLCKGNALVMCDTSSSMLNYDYCSYDEKGRAIKPKYPAVKPIDVAFGLAMYIAQHNKGDLKNMFLNFSDEPMFIELKGKTLYDNYRIAAKAPVNYSSTDLEAAFDCVLEMAIKYNIPAKLMPNAFVIASDMQINCVSGIRNGEITFYDTMKKRYAKAGYRLPHVVFWNVNAEKATFHANASDRGVSIVSGYSANIYKQVMENLGTTPEELMWKVINSERYSKISLKAKAPAKKSSAKK